MKGVVFTEFLEMVESQFGFQTADAIVTESSLESGGVYTSLGTYSHGELLTLVSALSEKTGQPISVLVRSFGHYLLKSFVSFYPEFFSAETECFGFLRKVEHHIHLEVRKLYTDTELPTFDFEMEGEATMFLTYRSHRPFAELAHGMIEATALHYGETVSIESEDLSLPDRCIVRFKIAKQTSRVQTIP
jgi:hypothetical protein